MNQSFPIYFLIFSYFSYDYRIFCVKFVGGSDWFLFSLYFFLFFRIFSYFSYFSYFFVFFPYIFPIFSYFPIRRSYFLFVFVLYLNRIYFVNK